MRCLMRNWIARWVCPCVMITGSLVAFPVRAQFPAELNVRDLDGTNGFILYGVGREDYSGDAVAGGGDGNDAGVADLVIGAPGPLFAEPFPPGYAYVVFGKAGLGGSGVLDLLDLVGNNG